MQILDSIIRFFRDLLWPPKSPPDEQPKEQPNDQPAPGGVPRPAPPPPSGNAPWLALARKEDGTREIPGKNHNSRILEYFADAGHPEIVDDETAWCAAFVGAMLKRSGYAGTGSLVARDYLKWGVTLDKPKLGAIAVFKRGNSSWQGHVGFYVGEDANYVFVLGGNQNNAVNVAKWPKSKLLGYRWPKTPMASRTVAALGLASLGEGLQIFSEYLPTIGAEFKLLAHYSEWFAYVGTACTVLGLLAALYARLDDMWNKGR